MYVCMLLVGSERTVVFKLTGRGDAELLDAC